MIIRMKNTFQMSLLAIVLSLLSLPGYSQQMPFPEKDYAAYLFTYFTGNHISEEAVCYAVSMDGFYKTEEPDYKQQTTDADVKMNFHPRHGTIIPITRAELKRITNKWGKPVELGELPNNPVLPGFHADPEILYSHQTQKYYIYSTTS